MSKPIHTPGPLGLLYAARSISIVREGFVETIARCEMESTRPLDETGANARLLAAAYNAFDSAAKKLGVNAVLLAEAMADGGIFDLIRFADKMQDYWANEKSPHHIDDLKATLRAVLTKVKEGAS
jgi:hypothetical protein